MKKYPLTGMMAGINVSSEIDALFENIPVYLSTHEKKTVLSKIAEGSTFDRYDEPLFWLDDSMICNLCYIVLALH